MNIELPKQVTPSLRHRAILGQTAAWQSGFRAKARAETPAHLTAGDVLKRTYGRPAPCLIFKLLLCCAFLGSVGPNQAATVTGNLTDVSLAPLNTKIVFSPTTDVLVTPSGLSAGPPRIIDTTNGSFSIQLEQGDYTVSLPLVPWRQPFTISVPGLNAMLTLTNLMSAPRTYFYTNPPVAVMGTVNSQRLANFWTALKRSNAVRVMAFGDSVGDAKLNGMLPALQGLLAQSGGIFEGKFHWNLDRLTNTAGLAWVNPDTNWWAKYYWLSNTGQIIGHSASHVTTGNQTNVLADSAIVYYIAEPGAGSFKVSVSANAGAWSDLATVNADSATYAGKATNFSFTLNNYRLKVEGLGGGASGRVKLIACGLWNDSAHTLRISYNTAPGQAWNDWTLVSTNVTWPIMKAEAPDLVLCEEKSSADVQRTNLPAIETMWAAVAPKADIVYIATTPIATNHPAYQDMVPQNQAMRGVAVRYGRMFWDGYACSPTYEEMVALGWTRYPLESSDPIDVHVNDAGNTYLGGLLFRELVLPMASLVGPSHVDAGLRGVEANLFNIARTNRLGIGTDTPLGRLDVMATRNSSLDHIVLDSFYNQSPAIWLNGEGAGNNFALMGTSSYTELNSPFGGGGTYFSQAHTAQMRLWASGGLEIGSYGVVDPGAGNLLLSGSKLTLGGVTITTGAAAPTASEPNGSLYLRTDGSLYLRTGGAWVLK
jgi:hypothetical protein